jgi:ubiquinone/menaquinone biosynthesis C-methylase UbiE
MSEARIAAHYAQGGLEQAILAALAASGKDPDRLTPDDLAPVDEFHVGGREATAALAAALPLAPGMTLLDVGSGIGGASRYFATAHGLRVEGIDLTAEYVGVASGLARRLGLGDLVAYRQGSALALPFDAGRFDGATMLHVGMNIAAKDVAFGEIRRVLKPGGFIAIYDIMRTDEGALRFPMPWAASEATSFVAAAAEYRRLLEAAGFALRHERNRRDFAREVFRRMRANAAGAGPPPLGLHLLMGAETRTRVGNMIAGIEAGLIAPVELVAYAA